MLHVISLINLAELANVIEPDTYLPGGVSAHVRKLFIRVRLRARTLLAWLNSRFKICVRAEGKLYDINEFAEQYLAYQMVSMRARKDFYDNSKSTSPFSRVTAEELDKELHGCRQHFSTTIRDQVFDVPTLSLPFAHRYEVQVVMKEVPGDKAVAEISGETFSDKEWQRSTG